MTSVVLLLLPTLSEGPLARVDLSWSRQGTPLEASLVDSAAGRLRGDVRVSETGLRVDAGCARERCTIALDGLAGAVDAALPALGDVLLDDAPRPSMPTRRSLRRSWSRAWRSTGRLLTAGLRSAAEGWLEAGAGPRPRLSPAAIGGAWAALGESLRAGELAAAGAYDEAVVRALAARIEAAPVAAPSPPNAAPTDPTLRPDATAASPTLLIDWPGATRAQLGIAWPTGPDDAVRDSVLAGDFESVLMQRLREREGYTYGVEPTWGDGWAGAVFDVATESVVAAIAAAREELAGVQRVDAATIEAATRRLRGRALALADTLAGRLALARLVPFPEVAPKALASVGRTSVVVVGDASVLAAALGPDTLLMSRCELMYGRGEGLVRPRRWR